MNDILRPIVLPYRLNIGEAFVFMDDNSHPHCAHVQDNDITRLEWPACSPDMNPFFFIEEPSSTPWVTSDIVPISPSPLQSPLFSICIDTSYKYRMVQFGLAWKINIKYDSITNCNIYSKITFIVQIFLQLII